MSIRYTILFRDVRQSVGQFVAFVLGIAVGAFFYAGLDTLSDDLNDSSKADYKEHNLSDLNVYYRQISKQDVESFANSRVTGRATVAHEVVGHYETYF